MGYACRRMPPLGGFSLAKYGPLADLSTGIERAYIRPSKFNKDPAVTIVTISNHK